MDDKKEYASDGDTSDEDFCPEEAPGDLSEEATDDDLSDNSDADNVGEASKPKASRSKAHVVKRKKIRKTAIKTKGDDSEDSETETKRISRHTTKPADISKGQEKTVLESDEETKKRSDALWADFLSDVKQPAVGTLTKSNEKESTLKTPQEESRNELKRTMNSNTKEKSGAAKATEGGDEAPAVPKKITVTEILDFAGEEVRVEKCVNADSIKENKLNENSKPHSSNKNGGDSSSLPRGPLKRPGGFGSSGSGSASSGGGLGALLGQIGKKKKLSVLEKSKLDWNTFKKDEGIEEELQTFNKGKDGYLERQDFLERTDLRQFEIEKNLRTAHRKF